MQSTIFDTVLPIFFARTREKNAEDSLLLCFENVRAIQSDLSSQSSQLQLNINGLLFTATPVMVDQIDTFDLSYRTSALPALSQCLTLPEILSLKQDKLATELSIQRKSITIQRNEEGNIELWKIEQEEKLGDRIILKIFEILSMDEETPPTISIDLIMLPIAFKGDLYILIEKKNGEINMELYNKLQFYNGCVKGLRDRKVPAGKEYCTCESNVVENGYNTSSQPEHCQDSDAVDDVINRVRTLIIRNNKGLRSVKDSDTFGELGLDSLELTEIEEIVRNYNKTGAGISSVSLGRIREVLVATGYPKTIPSKVVKPKTSYRGTSKHQTPNTSSIKLSKESYMKLQKSQNSQMINQKAEELHSNKKNRQKIGSHAEIEHSMTLSLEEQHLLIANEVHAESRAQFNETVSFTLNHVDKKKFHTVYQILIMQYMKLKTIYGPETIVLAGTECYQTFKELNYKEWNREGIDIAKEVSIQLLIHKLQENNGRTTNLIGVKFHHIAVDGESLKILLEEMNQLMKESSPEPKRATVTSPRPISIPAHLTYWENLLGTHTNDRLPLGKRVNKEINFEGASVSIDLPTDFGNVLQRISYGFNFSKIATLFHIFIYKITQIDRYCTGYAASNRNLCWLL